MKPVNIWNICKTQQTNIFQMSNACYKFMFGQKKKKKPFKMQDEQILIQQRSKCSLI